MECQKRCSLSQDNSILFYLLRNPLFSSSITDLCIDHLNIFNEGELDSPSLRIQRLLGLLIFYNSNVIDDINSIVANSLYFQNLLRKKKLIKFCSFYQTRNYLMNSSIIAIKSNYCVVQMLKLYISLFMRIKI